MASYSAFDPLPIRSQRPCLDLHHALSSLTCVLYSNDFLVFIYIMLKNEINLN